MTDLNYDNKLHLKNIVPPEAIEEVDIWIKKYPPERKRPPIMAALKVVQEHNGNYLTEEMMQAVAEYLDVPHVAVYEVATFYSMFHLDKVGKYVISVCNNISCSLRGADKVIQHLQNRLNIKVGETTDDELYTIKTVECMAACGGAPMLEVNKTYHENLTEEKIDQILSDIATIELNSDSSSEVSAEAKD
ncbi:NADH-quinone oxidoreductase subunit NuoE family protein [Aliikangiella sp. IMCC44359]|uniref:NADH-quinone oxidoreductase subunit NuoE family protein n=1 Tax=Aliikangiella sp. IMCC44359 TaxID=3459125 RepID=UPI00403ACAA5